MIEGFTDDVLTKLTPGELDFLYYTELHLSQIAKSTLDEAAESALSSPAVIERACKKLGLSGYSDLRYRIARELRGDQSQSVATDATVPFDPKSGIDQLEKEAARTTLSLSAEAMLQAGRYLVQANRVFSFGRGLSEFPSKYLSEYLERIGRPCRHYLDPPFAYRDAAQFTSKDAAVIFSSGGRTIPVVKAAIIAKKNDVPLIAVCSNVESPLAKLATLTFYAASSKLRMDSIDLNSRYTQFMVADLMVDAVIAARSESDSV
ncbi:MAG: MurR/RpiR family transcriptional regulator [Tractidigestivibacter sp.]|jgi:DNA-binding MurR/RpiR family transcriptional regulator|uniref:MurR/RpiR family transcriptional regulator n=1 Tax=Tractidigestivibacter sp. TaxID=2847320 RepID=UPI003D8B98BA